MLHAGTLASSSSSSSSSPTPAPVEGRREGHRCHKARGLLLSLILLLLLLLPAAALMVTVVRTAALMVTVVRTALGHAFDEVALLLPARSRRGPTATTTCSRGSPLCRSRRQYGRVEGVAGATRGTIPFSGRLLLQMLLLLLLLQPPGRQWGQAG